MKITNTVTHIDTMVSQGSWFTQGTNDVLLVWGVSNNLSFGVLDYLKPLTYMFQNQEKGKE